MDEQKISMDKDFVYGGTVVLLVVLLVLSIFTSGFGLIDAADASAALPSAGSGSTNASGSNSASAVSGSGTAAAATLDVKELMDDDLKMGSDSADVVIVEFSDLQCPFCRSFFTQTFDSLKKDYVDTGKVQYVFRDFPLSFHPSAQKAAQAVECAREQNKGWEMHDKIYNELAKEGSGTIQFTTEDIKGWATEEGLNASEFDACLDSGKYSSEVSSDLAEGTSYGVSGTPSFIITTRDGSRYAMVSGAQPYSTFKNNIDQLLQ